MRTSLTPGLAPARRARRSSRFEQGQALVFGLLFAAVAAIVVLMMFNSALLTTTKSQLQNAADAGAYSAALLQARDANFSAYTNRAMIANQVAVAQFVSLKSYFDDAAQTHERANSFLHNDFYRYFPTNAPLWDAAIQVPVDTARQAVGNLAPTAVKALDLLIDGLDQAQQIHHVGTMANMMLVADNVVKRNDPQARVTSSAFMLADGAYRVSTWGNDAVKRFSANDTSAEADRFADAVVDRDSTDWFIRLRASVPVAAWASTVKFTACPFAANTSTLFAFGHFGGTILSTNKKRWLALDATMGGGFASCTWVYPCITGVCSTTVTLPFPDIGSSAPYLGGNGGAVAGAGGDYDDTTGYRNNPVETMLYGGALISPALVPALQRYATGPGTSLDTDGGLQDHYRDVANPLSGKPPNQSAEENGGRYPITVEVERTAATVRDTTKFMAGSSQLNLDAQLKGNTMRALSSAHAYFYRPRIDSLSRFTRNGWGRDDGRTEYQNLFSPYWQARLAPTTLAEQAAAAAGQ